MQLTTLLSTFATLASLTVAVPVEDLSARQIVYNCYFNKSGVVSNYLVTVGSSPEVTVSGTTYELDCGTTSSPTVDPASPEDQSRWVYAKCQDGAVLPVWRSTTSVTCNI